MRRIYVKLVGIPEPQLFYSDEETLVKLRADLNPRQTLLRQNLPSCYIPAERVQKGDWVLVPRRQGLYPAPLSDEQLYTVGFWLADGYYLKEGRKNRPSYGDRLGLRFTNTERVYLDAALDGLSGWFPAGRYWWAERTTRIGNPVYDLIYSSRDAADYFYRNFGEYAHDKHIDGLIDYSGLLPLLGGFIDGDGAQDSRGSNEGRVLMMTTSEQLGRQLQRTLWDEGIWATLAVNAWRDGRKDRHMVAVPPAYAHVLATWSYKVRPAPPKLRSHTSAIPAPEGFYARVKGVWFE